MDWGDESVRSTYSGTEQIWSHDYGSAGDYVVRIFGSVALTKFKMDESDANISFDLAHLPVSLKKFRVTGDNTVFGSLARLSRGLVEFVCWGDNIISGDLAHLPEGLETFTCWGDNIISGDLAKIPDGVAYFKCGGNNVVANYSGKTWTTKPSTFVLKPVSPGGLSTAEVDQLLIDFDDDLTWASGNVINLTGANAARSSASDAAVASIEAEGATVITN